MVRGSTRAVGRSGAVTPSDFLSTTRPALPSGLAQWRVLEHRPDVRFAVRVLPVWCRHMPMDDGAPDCGDPWVVLLAWWSLN